MSFEEKISTLTPFFQKNKFAIAESSKDYIRYESEFTELIICVNSRENSVTIFVGRRGTAFSYELSGDLICNFFKSSIRLVNDEFFAENLMQFLNDEGNAILKGDLGILTEIEQYNSRISKKYADMQNINAADKAWSEKKYADFIKYADKIEKDFLPQSYLMKYQIALKKIV